MREINRVNLREDVCVRAGTLPFAYVQPKLIIMSLLTWRDPFPYPYTIHGQDLD